MMEEIFNTVIKIKLNISTLEEFPQQTVWIKFEFKNGSRGTKIQYNGSGIFLNLK